MKILNQNFRAVALETDTVVSIVNDAVLNDNVGASVSVPAIGVLGHVTAIAVPADCDVAKDNVGAVGYKIIPLRGVAEVDILNRAAVETDCSKEDGTQNVDVLCIEIVPDLAVSVKSATAVDVDVCASELEKGGGVLEDLLESVFLPVVCVGSELNITLDVCAGSAPL